MIPSENSQVVKGFFAGINDVVIKMVDIIMEFAPYGVFALLATLIVEAPKWDLLKSLLLYSLTLILGLAILIVLYLIIVKIFTGKSPNYFLKGILPAQLVAFSHFSPILAAPRWKSS